MMEKATPTRTENVATTPVNTRSADIRLTRIRTNFWTFQEKYPVSGANPARVSVRGSLYQRHAAISNNFAEAKQTEIAGSNAEWGSGEKICQNQHRAAFSLAVDTSAE